MPRMSQCKGVCVCICLLHASCIYLLQLYGASSLLSESTGLRGPETRELMSYPVPPHQLEIYGQTAHGELSPPVLI